jgi:hypothetical protein
MKFTLTNQHIDDFDLDYKRDRVEVTVNGDHIGYYQLDEIEVVVDSVDIDISGEDLCDELEKEDALELFRLLQEKFEFDSSDLVDFDAEPEWEPGLDKFPGRTLTVPEGKGGYNLARALAEIAPGDIVLDAVLRFTEKYACTDPAWAKRLAFVALRAAGFSDSTKELSMLGRETVRLMISRLGRRP